MNAVAKTELDEFDQHTATLCAAFNIPLKEERRAAYRKSLGRLKEVAWARIVEFAIGEEGPKELPTTGECWRIYRKLRAPAGIPKRIEPASTGSEGYTAAQRLANQLLVDWLHWQMRSGGNAPDETVSRAMYERAREIADQWQLLADDGDAIATPKGFAEQFCAHVVPLMTPDRSTAYLQDLRTRQRETRR